MEKVVYKIDFFTDFSGLKRQVIFCAVTLNKQTTIIEDDIESDEDFEFSEKYLSLGVSVQNPQDLKPNEELGKTIALGKAKKDKSCIGKLYTTNKGFINQKVVEALLEQEMSFFKNSPGMYLKGYNKDKELYQKNAQAYLNKYKINAVRVSPNTLSKAIDDSINNLNF